MVRTAVSSGRPDLHWLRGCGVDDGEFSNPESGAEATIREVTDNASFRLQSTWELARALKRADQIKAERLAPAV